MKNKNRSPAFQFYPKDWLSSTDILLMTPAQEGAYIRLLSIAWLSEDCGLPDNDEQLATLSRLGSDWSKGSSKILRSKFYVENGRLYNERLIRERKSQADWREKCSLGGKHSWEARKETKNQRVVQKYFEVKPNTASPSSTATAITTKESVFSLPDFLQKQTWELFIDHRKKLKHPITEKAYPSFVEKFRKLHEKGWPPDRVVDVMVEKGWRWFRPEWVQEPPPEKKVVDLVGQERRAMQQDREQNRDEYLDPEQVAEITKKLGLDFGKGRTAT